MSVLYQITPNTKMCCFSHTARQKNLNTGSQHELRVSITENGVCSRHGNRCQLHPFLAFVASFVLLTFANGEVSFSLVVCILRTGKYVPTCYNVW